LRAILPLREDLQAKGVICKKNVSFLVLDVIILGIWSKLGEEFPMLVNKLKEKLDTIFL